jgi:hypothetical protein
MLVETKAVSGRTWIRVVLLTGKEPGDVGDTHGRNPGAD